MGLFANIKNWFTRPLQPNADPVSLFLYIGVIFIVVWLWNSIILQVGRIGKAVTV